MINFYQFNCVSIHNKGGPSVNMVVVAPDEQSARVIFDRVHSGWVIQAVTQGTSNCEEMTLILAVQERMMAEQTAALEKLKRQLNFAMGGAPQLPPVSTSKVFAFQTKDPLFPEQPTEIVWIVASSQNHAITTFKQQNPDRAVISISEMTSLEVLAHSLINDGRTIHMLKNQVRKLEANLAYGKMGDQRKPPITPEEVSLVRLKSGLSVNEFDRKLWEILMLTDERTLGRFKASFPEYVTVLQRYDTDPDYRKALKEYL